MGTPGTYTISQTDFTNGYFVVDIGISEVPSFVQFTCGSPTSANAVCNTAWVAVTTDQQQLVENTSSTTAYFNPGIRLVSKSFYFHLGRMRELFRW